MTSFQFLASRRLFVGALASAGASLTLPLPVLAAEARRQQLTLVVITDTHLGYQSNEAAEQLWKQTAAEVAAVAADLVLHLGDLVDRGQEPLYPRYLEHRRQIKSPVHEIPGNHDPQELFEKYIRKPVDTVVDHQWLRLLLLNNSRTDSHDGFLSKEQLTWIESELADAAKHELLAIVCMHVPAHSNKHPDRGWHIKTEHGQQELYAALARHSGRVLALFHGHFHNGLRGWDDTLSSVDGVRPVHEICFPSALYNQDRMLTEQQAPGYNVAEFRPAYCVVTLGNGKLQVQLRVAGQGDAASKELPVDA
jgi:3',5'-cyclic AMP phosphodiesterase CpdA